VSYFRAPAMLSVITFMAFSSAHGATVFTVTTLDDDGPGSFRRAVYDSSSGDMIRFASGVVGEIVLSSEISVLSPKNLTIVGPGARVLSIYRPQAGRILNIPGNLHVSGLSFGQYTSTGGGIYGEGDGVFTDCAFLYNTAPPSESGGALFLKRGSWSFVRCTFDFNSSEKQGGAIGVAAGVSAISLTDCRFTGNEAIDGYGGAIVIADIENDQYLRSTTHYSIIHCDFAGNKALYGGALAVNVSDFDGSSYRPIGSIARSSFSFNLARLAGGAICDDGINDMISVQNSSFSSNSSAIQFQQSSSGSLVSCTIVRGSLSPFPPGEITPETSTVGVTKHSQNVQTVSVKNCIVALNSGTDVSGTFLSQGYNLIGNRDGSAGFGAPGDITGSTSLPKDPKLRDFDRHYGEDFPLPGSPVLDAGKNDAPTIDQHGHPRPVDFPGYPNAAGGDGSDIGALEVQPAKPYHTDFDGDGFPDLVLFKYATQQTAIWYLTKEGQVRTTAYGVTLPYQFGTSVRTHHIVGVTDMNSDGKPDYFAYHPLQSQTDWQDFLTVMLDNTTEVPFYEPHYPRLEVPRGWSIAGLADMTGDGLGDLILLEEATRRIAIWHLFWGQYRFFSAYGPFIPAGWSLAGLGDFDRDGKVDFLLANPGIGRTAIWYMKDNVKLRTVYGPNLVAGYAIVGVSDMNNDGKVDLVLENFSTRRLAYWFLSDYQRVGSAYGPALPAGYDLVGP
jgi:hypothetical protein